MTWKHIIVGLALLGTWAAFAYLNMTPVEPLIDYIKLVAIGLGFVKVALINPNTQKGDKP